MWRIKRHQPEYLSTDAVTRDSVRDADGASHSQIEADEEFKLRFSGGSTEGS